MNKLSNNDELKVLSNVKISFHSIFPLHVMLHTKSFEEKLQKHGIT